MVKHIVLFRLKEGLPAEEKRRVALTFKQKIEQLPAVISFIVKVEVGININADEKWDIALYSEFESLDDVKAYSAHPAHVAAAGCLAGYKEDRACVDYEIG